MIIISNTPKIDVIFAIDKEQNYLQGLGDTIQLLSDNPENLKAAEGYVQRNAVLKGIESDVRKGVSSTGTLISQINFSLIQLNTWLPKLKDRVVKSKTNVYDIETISFKEKGILDIISSINFFSRYAGMVLNILITESDKEVPLNSFLTKVDIGFFTNTAKYFSHLLVKFNQSIKSLEQMVDDLSDETYDVTSESIIRSQLGEGSVSVRNLAPHELNPLFWYKRQVMKKDIKRIIDANADIDMLAMKIARLNNRRTGVEDPALERQIEVYQNEMIIKQSKIAQIEARYGD